MATLELDGIGRRFGDTTAVDNISLSTARAYSWLSHRGCDGSVVLVTGGASRPPSVPNRETSKETTYVSGQTGSISTKQPGDGRPLVVSDAPASDLIITEPSIKRAHRPRIGKPTHSGGIEH